MKVKTLRPHQNIHGRHAKDDEYDHRRPEADLNFGYVEMVPAEEKTVAELEHEAEEEGIALPKSGSSDGRPIKQDIVKAVTKARK